MLKLGNVLPNRALKMTRNDVTECKEQKSTTRDEVEWRDCCSLHVVTSSVIYYSTHARTEKCNLFVLYNKNSNSFFEGFWGHEKKRKTNLLMEI